MRLENQVAVITGGANGIGRATAIRFAEEGADIVVADVLAEPAAETVAAVEALGRQAIFVQLDAASRELNEAMADAAVERFGRIDVVMTAAGITHGGYVSGDVEADRKMLRRRFDHADQPGMAFCAVELDDWQRVIDVNLTGTFLALQACGRRMIDLGIAGRCITIASIAAKHPDAGPVAYTVSKAGVWMLTKKAARELAPAGIRVNAIGPGFIATNMTTMVDDFAEVKDALMGQIPLGRMGQPLDIANAALFLASDESSYMTGEILHPDGGYFTE
ncbi:MAG: SDR family oxidoreductase [Acidimicrobiia bacterium]|nr:SDR family oxidoreductase [Acidimicrobiia bacterium]